MKINSETWKNFGFSGIGWVLIFRFGLGFNPGFRGRVPITTRFTHQNNFSRQIFQYGKNNYSILMLLTIWEKSIDLARIFLHAPLGRKIVIKKYLFSLMKILVRSFLNFISHLLCTFCRYCFWNRIRRRRFKPFLQMTVGTKF